MTELDCLAPWTPAACLLPLAIMSRKPLRNYNQTLPMGSLLPLGMAETPISLPAGKMSTPPHSVYIKRNLSMLDTPVRGSTGHLASYHSNVYDNGNGNTLHGHGAPRSVLLSPVFSSPQPPKPPVFENPVSLVKSSGYLNHPMEPTPFLAPAISDLDLSLDEAPKKKRLKKHKREPREQFSLDSTEKPPYSYATLIGMSILTHPDKQLTLSQIYLWISETFKYYRREDVGWQNLIRHNLSLNKAFVKGVKSKDGKGHFWCIKPECEDLFLKAKNNKKSLYHEVMDQLALARRSASLNSLPLSPTALASDDVSRKRNSDYSDEDGPAKRHHSDLFWDKDRPDSDTETGPDVDSSLLRTPAQIAIVTESSDKPLLAGKHLAFASSFSCSLNFELLPVHPLETGPLLEPLTPAPKVVLLQTPGNMSVQLPSITINRAVSQHLPQLHPPIPTLSTPRAAGTAWTPKSSLKTPLRTLKTPLGSTMIRKLWNSPSYLEEFYYSPFGSSQAVLNSYDDDDMLMRAFDSPASPNVGRVSLLSELKKAVRGIVETPQSEVDVSVADVTDIDGSIDSE